MVWYNGGSELDKIVERHNSGSAESKTDCGCSAPIAEDDTPPKRCDFRREPQNDLLSLLTKDRDLLLLAAVLLILMHEKADKKLILALAFVLFA